MDRLKKVRDKFNELGIDGLLVTNSKNRRYMTGFTGSAGIVIISPTKAVFITDFRYVEQAKNQVQNYEIVQHKGPVHEEVARLVKELGIQHLGFEQDEMTFGTFKIYENAVSANMVPISGVIEKLRLIKTDEELQILKEAASVADQAFEHIIKVIKPGVNELEISNELEFFMRKKGATSSSFDTIVASGFRSALPHGVASDKVIKAGELVTLDFGAYYKGYCSDITRTVGIGDIKNDQLKTIYDIVLQAQLLGMNGIKAGMTGKQADALTRDYISAKGYGDYFGHSTGHGIGLDIHEGPALSVKSDTILEPGMVVTVEPGIYLEGVGGVRIEDDIVITKDGNIALTHSPKELLLLY
ncbi:Xaa-Pro aminopeptidase [Schinkia azotoformans MEV2011]|uniref:Xaa-Pro aminopeptidase n=1 Tax=Schinkia azotoformans MEV2011 TaxID=1348973 RepID=A0A072NIT3_SCHAZ|nr:Xaa-Pro peptidase family protein [Schinkia azotoformans]KEF37421.1 Xaa-Pro aminopeptidase [Schinkia azotoformans MEV2011]MEC1694639.1 Xaa-Pro peptidase family protein [Schinkia azotoformans]MEC1769626.1 Xaa-Pro peptidase family protein [Schinkia azotoformans]MED4366292.1 Xaa-Pro peptidase family protein [Schinkia azotoformans]MED4378348.1 Xaa-Pro peptidase family protein [Schinkia azotoformans]